MPFGYWEANDEQDDLEAEIAAKFRKGYPKDNIVFTDDVTAVLYQDGGEATRAHMQAPEDSGDDTLLKLLTRFFAHERQEIADFNKAVKQFATDLPAILTALRAASFGSWRRRQPLPMRLRPWQPRPSASQRRVRWRRSSIPCSRTSASRIPTTSGSSC